MTENLIQKPGNIYKSPVKQPKPKPPSTPDGIRPNWTFDSETNRDSWKDIFDEMFEPIVKRRTK